MAISLIDFIKDISDNYSVQNFEDIEAGIFVAKIKEDVYLMNHVEVKENSKG